MSPRFFILAFLALTVATARSAEQPPNVVWSSWTICPRTSRAMVKRRSRRRTSIGSRVRGYASAKPSSPRRFCSPSRSALITGMYQTTIGWHTVTEAAEALSKIHLPEGVEPIPLLFKRNGYYTAIGGPLRGERGS